MGKRSGLAKALLAGAGLIAGAFVVRGAIQRAGRARAYLSEGIDEKTWIRLGGIEQWVTIRGRDEENPILLVLHGGPGSAFSPLATRLFAGWEDHFTVVNWDQRGAGRSFARNGKAASAPLTIGRMVVDGVELTEELARRFPGRPIVILGVSWGSLLGIEMVRARPDLFAAFVGAGQVVDMAQGESLSYFAAIDRLRARGDERGAQALEAVGPPPYADMKGLMKQRKLLISTMPKAERHALRHILMSMLTSPDARLSDFVTARQAMRFTMAGLWDAVLAWKLTQGGLAFEVPLVFIQGDLDLQTPTALVTEIMPKLQAPAKELVIVEDAGHFALLTHPDRVRREMVERVLPFTLARPKSAKRKRQGA